MKPKSLIIGIFISLLSIGLVWGDTVREKSRKSDSLSQSIPQAQAPSESTEEFVRVIDALEETKIAQTIDTQLHYRNGYIESPLPGLSKKLVFPFSGSLIIQFPRRILQEDLTFLKNTRVRIIDYIQNNAYLAFIPEDSADELLGALNEGRLRYIGPYPVEARLDPSLMDYPADGIGDYGSQLYLDVHIIQDPSAGFLKRWRERVFIEKTITQGVRVIRLKVERMYLDALLSDPDVIWIEPYIPGQLHNLEAQMSGGADRVLGYNTYDGTGIIVAVNDTGLARTATSSQCGGNTGSFHPDIGSTRVIYDWDYQNNDTYACDDNSHGTHTAGTIGGDGTNTPEWMGIAPGVRFLIYKDCCNASGTGFGNFNNVLTNAASRNANIVANSWGGGNGGYNTNSQLADNAVRGAYNGSDSDPQYMVVTISSGNDNDLTSMPGTAKNAITVGAMKDGNWPDDGPWCWCVNNSNGVCGGTCASGKPRCGDDYWPARERICFSNKGPIDTDGDSYYRVKPDVVAPGTRIMSLAPSYLYADSRLYQPKNGTSMAQPIVAGTVALMMDSQPGLLDWPEMFKARLIATAIPLGSTNTYGHGMVDTFHAVYDSSSLDTLVWQGNYITGSGNYRNHTFTVPSGFKQVRVVLTWSDPPSTTTEVVNDLDLRVYDANNTLVGSSTFNDHVVEKVFISSGTAGSWRAEVRGFNVPQPNAKYSIIAVVILNNPSLGITASGPACIAPGDSFTVNTTLSNSGRTVAAAQIAMDMPDTLSNLTLNTVTIPNADARSHTYTAGELWNSTGSNITYATVGAVNSYISRSVQWNFTVPSSVSDGSFVLYITGNAYAYASGTFSYNYKVDGTPASDVSNLSSSHAVGSCSNDLSVSMYWTAASDGIGCGIDGYGIFWSSGAPGMPAAIKDIANVTSYVENLPESTSARYFNIRTVDLAGNWTSSYVSYGPFYLDATAPGYASNISSITHPIGSCSGDPNITLAWTSATDDNCGVDGYSYLFTVGATGLPDTFKDIGNITTLSANIGYSNSPRYFNLRTVDVAGNWTSSYVSYGPFTVDIIPGEVQNLRLKKIGTDIVMNWNAISYADYYNVYKDTDVTFGTRVLMAQLNTGTLSYTFTNGVDSPEPFLAFKIAGTNICGAEGTF